jgi:MFS family permease
LNEAKATERTITQGIVTLFISIGQLTGAALIGAVASSNAAGTGGYMQSFLILSGIGLVLFGLSFRLQKREVERTAKDFSKTSR